MLWAGIINNEIVDPFRVKGPVIKYLLGWAGGISQFFSIILVAHQR